MRWPAAGPERSGCGRAWKDRYAHRSWLVHPLPLEINPLLADGEVALQHGLVHGVEAVVVAPVDEASLPIFQLVEDRRFLELAAQVGELVIAPDFLKSQPIGLFAVPCVIEVELAGILAAIALGLRLCLLPLRRTSFASASAASRFALSSSAAGTNTGRVTSFSFPAWSPGEMNTFGVVVRICVSRDLAELQRVLIAVVRYDMHVGCAVRHLGLDGDEPAGDVPPSNTQLDVSPPNTVATFSSAGNKIRVD